MAAIVFKAKRRSPELIAPATATPRELKLVSDIDDQDGLRTLLPTIFVYASHPSMKETDPVHLVRESLAKALVYYYPFAGRLREGPGRKLAVDCTGEGVLFVEAQADISLDQLSDHLHPPFPCYDELFFDTTQSERILDFPLMLLQVTRLRCGGIILALQFNHVLCDGDGLFLFLSAVADIAGGLPAPSVKPVWMREILSARTPPRVTFTHREYDDAPNAVSRLPSSMPTLRSFFFKLTQISDLKKSLPLHLRQCSNFEALTACLWRCRTRALQASTGDEIRIICIVNARRRFSPRIPIGYYGNCIAYSTQVTRAGELLEKPLGFAVELIRKAKDQITEEYMRSVADLMVVKGRPQYSMAGAFLVSDATKSMLHTVNLGWGEAVYGGPAKGHVACFHVKVKKKNGEEGILNTICLPSPAMARFAKELSNYFPMCAL